MRFAYADPPYIGQARKHYGANAKEVNHEILIGHLNTFDAWALSLSSPTLRIILPLCPDIRSQVESGLSGRYNPETIQTNPPQWTANTPTEPGLYWFAMIDSAGTRRHCLVWRDYGGRLVTSTDGVVPTAGLHRVWAGPLLEPVGEAVWLSPSPETPEDKP